jgi:(p)ppGpp synthase/HD superfamily hydrolase
MKLSWDQDKYISAYRFAAEAHKGQPLPGSKCLPYIIHVSLVSMEIIAALQIEPGLNGNLAVQCALLHDVIEDTGVTFEKIKTDFGEPVAKGVDALTKNDKLHKNMQMADCLNRVQQQPYEVWMVKLADRITNLQPPPKDWTRGKIVNYRKEAIEIHKMLGSASEFMATRLLNKIEVYKQFVIACGPL